MDALHTLSDEDDTACQYRDEPARAGLQHEADDRSVQRGGAKCAASPFSPSPFEASESFSRSPVSRCWPVCDPFWNGVTTPASAALKHIRSVKEAT